MNWIGPIVSLVFVAKVICFLEPVLQKKATRGVVFESNDLYGRFIYATSSGPVSNDNLAYPFPNPNPQK